jgi:hypothetical protein
LTLWRLLLVSINGHPQRPPACPKAAISGQPFLSIAALVVGLFVVPLLIAAATVPPYIHLH